MAGKSSDDLEQVARRFTGSHLTGSGLAGAVIGLVISMQTASGKMEKLDVTVTQLTHECRETNRIVQAVDTRVSSHDSRLAQHDTQLGYISDFIRRREKQ